jgi:hypothetical protein
VTAWAEERTRLLGEYAAWVSNLRYYGRLRQRAALSSFSIPDADVQDEIWKLRDGNIVYGQYYHSLQRIERQALQVHAEKSGCDLLIDPDFCLERHGVKATRARLEILLEFLKDKEHIQDIRVVISEKAHQANLTFVGDWFSAESFSPKVGESHSRTIFCRHAPTVLTQLHTFDDQFNHLLQKQSCSPDSSRDWAIGYISEIVQKRIS